MTKITDFEVYRVNERTTEIQLSDSEFTLEDAIDLSQKLGNNLKSKAIIHVEYNGDCPAIY